MKKRLFLSVISILLLSCIAIIYLKLNKQGECVLGCVILDNTGYMCSTCGFTDTLQYILCLDFANAYKSNPYMFGALPIWFFIAISFWWNYVKNGTFLSSKYINYLLLILLLTGAVFGILRNVL